VSLLPDVIIYFIDKCPARCCSRSAPEAAESVQQSVVSEIFPAFTVRYRDAIAENEQPIPGTIPILV
jgi:hypothetical protein